MKSTVFYIVTLHGWVILNSDLKGANACTTSNPINKKTSTQTTGYALTKCGVKKNSGFSLWSLWLHVPNQQTSKLDFE